MSATSASTDIRAAIGRGWKALVFAGTLGILGGIVAILLPPLAGLAAELFVGWVLIFSGVGALFDAFAVRSAGRTAARLILGLVTIAAGLYLVVYPVAGVLSLTLVLIVLFVFSGVARLVAAIRERGHPGAGLLALSAVTGIAVGVLIFAQLPSSAAWAIGLLVGIDLVFFGISALSAGLAGRRLAAEG